MPLKEVRLSLEYLSLILLGRQRRLPISRIFLLSTTTALGWEIMKCERLFYLKETLTVFKVSDMCDNTNSEKFLVSNLIECFQISFRDNTFQSMLRNRDYEGNVNIRLK